MGTLLPQWVKMISLLSTKYLLFGIGTVFYGYGFFTKQVRWQTGGLFIICIGAIGF